MNETVDQIVKGLNELISRTLECLDAVQRDSTCAQLKVGEPEHAHLAVLYDERMAFFVIRAARLRWLRGELEREMAKVVPS